MRAEWRRGSNAPSTRWRACRAIRRNAAGRGAKRLAGDDPGSRFAVSQTRRESRACPAPEAIDDLDRVARLLWRVEPHQRRLLWARACGVRWAELCRRARRSRTTLTRDHRLALAALAAAEAGPDRAETPGLPGKYRERKQLDIRYKIGYFLLYDARNIPCITHGGVHDADRLIPRAARRLTGGSRSAPWG